MKAINFQGAKQAALACVVIIFVAASWLVPVESVANQHIEQGLKRALLSFASARALNAVISVAQGTKVAVEPGGMGAIFAPGQLLDPLNDLVEQFGHLMLASSIAFGVEKILVSIGLHWSITLLLSATAIVWGCFYLFRRTPPPWITRILVVLVMMRFAMPLVIIGSDIVFQEFMAPQYQASQQILDATSGRLDTIDPPDAAAPQVQGFLARINGWVSQNIDPTARIGNLKTAAEQAIERIINLMVIFLLQTVIAPLFMLWVLWGVVKGTFERPHFSRLAVSPKQE